MSNRESCALNDLGLGEPDPVDLLLEGTRLRGSISCASHLHAPWAFEMPAGQRAGFHLLLEGSCWLTTQDTACHLEEGDLAILPHGAAHSLADSPARPPVPIQRMSTTADSRGRTCLSSPGEGALTRLLCGSWTHESGSRSSLHPLLALLPGLLILRSPVVQARDDLRIVLDLLLGEHNTGDVGSASVSSRLLDILFVTALRAWLDQADNSANWVAALRDPLTGPALRLLHGRPGQGWRLDELARSVGTSRSVLARRFTETVGEPPMTYLGRVRMQEAESLLRGSQASLAEIAARVGYGSEFAFIKAFKKWKGQPPGRWRAEALA